MKENISTSHTKPETRILFQKSKQMMHQKLLETLKETSYNNASVCAVINIGRVVFDFFTVYNEMEPLALCHREKLMPLLLDLNKGKIMSILLCFFSMDDILINLHRKGNLRVISLFYVDHL